MDTDGQQKGINDQVGHTLTDQPLPQFTSADQDATDSPSFTKQSFAENNEFRLSPIHFEDKEGEINGEPRINKAWKVEQLKDRAKNGDDTQKAPAPEDEVEEEGDFEAASEISFLKDTALTSSPSRSFKSSYAKSLADSYRRASLPVFISAPKGQFYFKNEEFLSLNSSQVKRSTLNQDKFLSLNSSANKTVPPPTPESASLPTTLDIVPEAQDQQAGLGKSDLNVVPADIYQQLLVNGDIFVPYERLHSLCEGGSFSLQDWHKSVSTNDGRKLINLSELRGKWNKKQDVLSLNGHGTQLGPDKDAPVESSFMEHEQLKGRIEQLCEVLADRDTTIQRLEEDLLRIRMECQRLIVDNRSLKSNISHSGAQSAGSDSAPEVSKLQQQVQLLTAQLNKAERSRHTYEAATRQLVDFLHTVNSTLNMTSNHSTTTSPATSPTTSFNSITSPALSLHTITPTSPDDDVDGDPPYRLAHPKFPSPDLLPSSTSHTFGPIRRNSDAVRKSGSVWALPTQSGNPRRVSRALSTHCVASAATGTSHNNSVASASHERGRTLTSDFLASRARELIASLKSLMRSDSVLKLNLEPKKSVSSVNNGSSTTRSTKSEGNCAVLPPDTNQFKAVARQAVAEHQNSGHGDARHHYERDKDQHVMVPSESDASPEVNQNFRSTDTTTVVPRIDDSAIREDTLQTQTSMQMNGNPQPLSLMVVGESSSTLDERHFSSLPNRNHVPVPRTLNDSDHRLVWV
ncbi:uncharacterized protein LOC121860613 [Homarus americanus]|uniref:Uncharacterized protein n=1 Tax=Homarus americanus TaxID=6706 RepID=A0A8J5T6M8_HOMAM|nr:uncharacterized protein LOC121860613 [Homarus americanus]XP_042213773.1 uncharacterized protein LOC121860613 [Homarus americanus]KAG7173399.1 hypothetical protein Hamer_G018685 [Homarus americanus]